MEKSRTRGFRPVPWHSQGPIRHSPGFGIVAQRVGMNILGEARAARGSAAGMPDGLGSDRLPGLAALEAGE